jgi:hypothetical protein
METPDIPQEKNKATKEKKLQKKPKSDLDLLHPHVALQIE